MVFLTWSLLGAVVGLVVKLLTPGRHWTDFFAVTMVGMGGAVGVGVLGGVVDLYNFDSTVGLVMSGLGAMLCAAYYAAQNDE